MKKITWKPPEWIVNPNDAECPDCERVRRRADAALRETALDAAVDYQRRHTADTPLYGYYVFRAYQRGKL